MAAGAAEWTYTEGRAAARRMFRSQHRDRMRAADQPPLASRELQALLGRDLPARQTLRAVLAVATVWMGEVGGAGLPAGLPKVLRALCALKQGLRRLRAALLRGEPLPPGRIEHHPWPLRGWQPDRLTEPLMDQC